MYEFSAQAWTATEVDDLGVFLVVLAENRDGSGRRVEIQRANAFDEQDKSLGHDTYCVVMDTGACCYGGVASWRVEDGRVEMLLDRVAADELGVTDGVRVLIAASEEEQRVLAEGLARALRA